MKRFAIIAAAGNGSRAKLNKNKLLFNLGDKTVLEKTVDVFLRSPFIDEIIVTANGADKEIFESFFKNDKNVRVVLGGSSRAESVKNALDAIADDGVVLIHDGARPYLSPALIERCAISAEKFGSGVAAVPTVDTIGVLNGDLLISTMRNGVCAVQTPQAFSVSEIKRAYDMASDLSAFTDDAGIYCKYIKPARFVEGERTNVKLTNPEDFHNTVFRTGTGFDLHRLAEGRKLILGGVEIPHAKGLLGHSDADVLLHAIMDALLSAASLRDIGYHFPDTDPRYKGISSVLLYKEVITLIGKQEYKVNNISATIMAEKPKLMKFVPEMTANIAKLSFVPESDVGIGCTTLEGIGTVGREEGIAVQAYCSLKSAD